jgi:hypothetical protein
MRRAMRGNLKSLHPMLIIICVALVSCSTTNLTNVWKDESFKGPVNNVFVIGVFKERDNRRTYENEFVKKLSAQGVNAIASYKEFGSGKLPDKEAIVSRMQELNMEAVLITNIVGKERRRVYAETWYQNYGHHYGYWHGRTTEFIDDIYHVETKLYDVRSEGLIWSALSKTVVIDDGIYRSDVKEIKKFINVMVKKLSDDGMLKQF